MEALNSITAMRVPIQTQINLDKALVINQNEIL
jgi:hypothetical protein